MTKSVALCTYNGAKFIRLQLESIFSQTERVDEVVICDDNSTDLTISILEEFREKYPEILKVHLNKEKLGTIKNFEKAISLTNGDLIFLADQDDIWYKDKVEIMCRFFRENTNCKLLFTDGDLVDVDNNFLNSTLWEKWCFNIEMRKKWKNNTNAFRDLISNYNKITGATVCFHNSLKATIFPFELPYGYWHDVWLGIHASAQNGLMFLEQSLIYYRIHDNQQVGISKGIIACEKVNSNEAYISHKLFFQNINKYYSSNKKNLLIEILKKIKKSLKMTLKYINK